MSRTRLIRPAFFKHADLYDAEVEARLPLRLAFAGLWTVADREGRFPWKPRELKTDILPHDPVDFGAVLDALERHGFVRSYVVDGKRFGLIPSFGSHQTFHRTEPGSKLPPPVATPLETREAPVGSTADAVAVAVTVADRVVVGGEIAGVLGNEQTDYAMHCCIVANRAVTAKWGEQASPYIASGAPAHDLAQSLREAGVPLEVAKASIVRQIERSGKSAPPTTMKWFLRGVLDAHALVKQQAADPSVASPRMSPGIAEAEEVFERAVTLARMPIQAQPADKIRALWDDPPTKAGLKKVGGLPGIRECRPDRLIWLKKDFIAAYTAAGASAA